MDQWRWRGIEKVLTPCDLLKGINYLFINLEEDIANGLDIIKVSPTHADAKTLLDWSVKELNAVLTIADVLSLSYWVRQRNEYFFENTVPRLNDLYKEDLFSPDYGKESESWDIKQEDLYAPMSDYYRDALEEDYLKQLELDVDIAPYMTAARKLNLLWGLK